MVQQELDDEFMGFTPNPCRHGLFQLMCDLLKQSVTLGDLLRQVIRFYNLVGDDLRLSMDIGRERASFNVRLVKPEYDPEYFLQEFLLVIWHRFPSWYIGEPIVLHETHFNFAEPLQKQGESNAAYHRRLKRYSSIKPARFAIELRHGTTKSLGIRVGDSVQFDTKEWLARAR